MKSRIVMLAALVAGLGLTAQAQGPAYPVVEIFGGYALSRQMGEANLNGWHGQAAVNLSEHFGLVGDVSHHYMGEEPGEVGVAGLEDARLLSYTVGPRAYNRDFEPWTMFVHALFGQSRLVGQADVGGGMTERAKFRPFTMTLGGGVDFDLTENVALRVVEIDYRLLRVDSHSSSGVRFSTGVNFKF